MTLKEVTVTLVTLKEPCSACLIIDGLIQEMLNKLKKKYENIVVEYIILDNLKQVHQIPGLEVEKFPAILINNEQFTAGSLPSFDNLLSTIKREEAF